MCGVGQLLPKEESQTSAFWKKRTCLERSRKLLLWGRRSLEGDNINGLQDLEPIIAFSHPEKDNSFSSVIIQFC